VPNPDLDYEVISECLGQIDFADASDNYPDQWTWNFGDGSPTSNEQDPSHQYAQSGTYQVILQACNFLGCQTDTIPVTINNVVYANFAYNNGNPAGPPFVNQGTPIQFVDNTEGAISWVWTFGNGSGNQGNPTPVTFYTQQGTYTVTLEVTTASGCTRTTTQVIQVVATGINTPMPDAANVQLQPNPATDRVKVSYQFTGTETVNMQLFDAVGQLITSQQQANVSQQYQTDISLANLPKGVYFVTLQTSKGVVTKKLTIQ
jgi:PKD repeat protein